MADSIDGTGDTLLTDARQALWRCIENYEPLEGAFRQKFKFEDDPKGRKGNLSPGNILSTPSPKDLPAISIVPELSNTPWFTNVSRRFAYNLSVIMWFDFGHLVTPELRVIQVARAVYSKIDGVPHLHEVCGNQPEIGSTSFREVLIGRSDGGGGIRCWVATLGVTLQIPWYPLPS